MTAPCRGWLRPDPLTDNKGKVRPVTPCPGEVQRPGQLCAGRVHTEQDPVRRP